MIRFLTFVLLLVSTTLTVPASAADVPLEARLRETVTRLSSFGSRVTGYPGCDAAADTLAVRLRAMGVDEVLEHRFELPVPVDEGFVLTAGEQRVRLFGVWPNLVRTSTVPPGGIAGELLDAGDGRLDTVSGRSIEGRIVLMDYACENRWVDFFHLGARAVVFLGGDRAHRKEAELKFLDVPADLPRFFATEQDAVTLRGIAREGENGRITGRMTWQTAEGRTLFGFIEGRDPDLRNELVLLSAYYDAMSPIPAIAPGAEQACGVSGVLAIARDLCRQRPGRSLAFVLTSGHFQNLAGIRSLMPVLLRSAKRVEGDGAPPDDGRRLEGRLTEYDFRMLIDVDLSSQSHVLAAVKPSAPYRTRLIVPPITNRLMTLVSSYEDSVLSGQRAMVNGLRQDRSRSALGGLPQTVPSEGSVAALAGCPTVTFTTANDSRAGVDSPYDLPESVDWTRLSAQVELLGHLVRGLADDAELPAWDWGKNAFGTIRGEVVEYGPRSFLPDQPVAGALVRVRLRNRALAGVRGDFWVTADDSGRFTVPGVATKIIYTQPVRLEAYRVDDLTGAVTDAPDRGINGERRLPGRALTVLMDDQDEEVQVVTSPSVGISLFETFDPRNLVTLDQISVIDAAREAEPSTFGACLPLTTPELDKFGYANRVGSWVDPTAVAFVSPGTRLKATMTSGRFGIGRRLVLLNADPGAPKGAGYVVPEETRLPESVHRVAVDMTSLNGVRIGNLAKHGVRNGRLTAFHLRAGSLLEDAGKARIEGRHRTFLSASRGAWAYSAAAYRDVSGTQAGVIGGALFLLAALIPFAHFSERLAFGFPDLKRQVIGYFGFFLAGFLALRYLHPAFELSISPSVILLGFVILTLGILVMGMGISRLNRELRELARGRRARVRKAAARSGAVATSVAVGLAHMRRRPLRTGLTCCTLVLLTFSVLSFTSIRSSLRTNRIPTEGVARYDGVLVRMPAWQKMEVTALKHFRDLFGAGQVAPRAWMSTASLASTFRLERETDPGRSAGVLGAVGLTAQEAEAMRPQEGLRDGRWLLPGEVDACLLPQPVADSLGIAVGDPGRVAIRMFGERFTVVGILASDALDSADLNGEPITPLDPEAQQPPEPEVGKTGSGGLPVFTHLPAAQVVVLPYSAVMRWEPAYLASVAVRTATGGHGISRLAETLDLNLFEGEGGRRYLVNTVGVATVSGLWDLIIPVAIGALIVLNTMLGAVYERTREIGTFNAVGLAPAHVSGLFLAEACAYAVVGGVLGYVTGLAAAQMFARFGLLSGLELNYSSMSAIMALGLVMVVVAASALYPARLASRICTPGIERRWRPPAPEGDVLQMDLPFTLARSDAVGMAAFLAEFWESFGEQSIGAGFYVEDLSMTREGDTIGLHARTWLAPFDQGITQDADLRMTLQPDSGYYAIAIRLQRLEGDFDTWRRVCRTFLDDLRKQFLIWRTLSTEDRGAYVDAATRGDELEAD